MKRILSLLLASLLFFGTAQAQRLSRDPNRYVKQYPLHESGEAIVNDVPFYSDGATSDGNRVFYEIFVSSFSDSNGDGIGDLRGIINRMDYLNDGDPTSGLSLGVEGIWLTPIYASPSYHKYDVADFYQVDPDFGTLEDLKELIALCHERDVKLILDLPINHTSTEHRWFKNFVNSHRMNNPLNTYYDFYVWQTAGETTPAGRHFARVAGMDLLYEANFSDAMPEPNYANPLVRETMLDVAKYYLNLGVDGFRFDAAKYIYYGDNAACVDFWSWYLGELRALKPDLYTVAEVWDGDGIIDQYLPVTSCFNFTASQASGMIAQAAKGGDVNSFVAYMSKYLDNLARRSDVALPTLFIANHDTDRAAGYLTLATGRAKVAATLYLLSPGSPFIYYGEEIGLRGSRGSASTDANRRLAMLWGDGDTVADPEGTTYAKSNQTPYSVLDQKADATGLYTHYKQLLMIRRANPEIARGEYTALSFPDSKAGGFLCSWNGRTVAVLHNTTTKAVTLRLSEATELEFHVLSAFVGAGKAVLEGDMVTLDAQTSAVLRME